nr:HAMP domain-containing sensor histidine kinase [Natronospira proteinivora]
MAAVIPIAILLALTFTGLITRPIRQLDYSIRSLAHPEAGPIKAVKGPRDLKVLSVRLEWARRRLSRIERDRQRLLGQVSHELKTPLSAIREGVGLLEEELLGPLAPRQSEVVTILGTSTARLEEQIESLLRFNRIRGGLQPAQTQSVAVRALFDEALLTHSLSLSARDIQVETHLDDGLAVWGDPDMLRTALDNLLSNAIKFSPAGSRVGLFAVREEGTVRIRVSDNGRGIGGGDRHRVFEPFYRGPASAEGAVPGSGLGLSICRDLIRAHGGDVTLARSRDWKTTFEIRLSNGTDDVRNRHAD